MEQKISKAIELLDEVKKEEQDRKMKIKSKILDNLSHKECNYFLIKKNDDLISEFEVYGIKCDSYEKAYEKCEDLVEDEDEFWLLHKDELENLLYAINYNVTTQEIK